MSSAATLLIPTKGRVCGSVGTVSIFGKMTGPQAQICDRGEQQQ